MRLRHIVQTFAAASTLALTAPVFAQDAPGTAPVGPDTRPEWKGDAPQPGPSYSSTTYSGAPTAEREGWLADCRRKISDNGLGGALIGGVAGGVIGNRVAGRGNRTVGTIAGAAVGAVAGAAIDKAEDSGRVKDYCESYLDDYYARANYARANPGYAYAGGYGYQGGGYPGYAYVPVQAGCCQAAAPRAEDCGETVEYEYVDAPAPRARIIRRAPDKRVRVAPDKRIRTQ